MGYKNKNNVSLDFLVDFFNPMNAYILGYLWADGSLYSKTNTVSMEIKSEDFFFEDFLIKNGISTIYIRNRKRKENSKKTSSFKSFQITGKKIYNFLREFDYETKSLTGDARKILSKIPDHLKHYWWRGYFDGDGCVFFSSKQNVLNFSGNIQQPWDFINELFLKLEIQGKTREKKYPQGNSSEINVKYCEGIQKFFKFIYPNGFDFGLKRKFEIFLLIENRALNPKRKKPKYKGINFINQSQKWRAIFYSKNSKPKSLGLYKTEEEAYQALQNHIAFIAENEIK